MHKKDELREKTKPHARSVSLETYLQGEAQFDMEEPGEAEFARVREAIAALDPRNQEFIELEMVALAPRREIEQRLGIPPAQFSTVKAQVMSALRDLLLARRR